MKSVVANSTVTLEDRRRCRRIEAIKRSCGSEMPLRACRATEKSDDVVVGQMFKEKKALSGNKSPLISKGDDAKDARPNGENK